VNPIGFWLARPLSRYCGAVVGLDDALFGCKGFEEDRERAEQANEHHDLRGDQNASANRLRRSSGFAEIGLIQATCSFHSMPNGCRRRNPDANAARRRTQTRWGLHCGTHASQSPTRRVLFEPHRGDDQHC
jgi:hypothetical protein